MCFVTIKSLVALLSSCLEFTQVFILIRNLFKMFSDTKNNNFMGTHFNVAQSRSEIKVQLVFAAHSRSQYSLSIMLQFFKLLSHLDKQKTW